tara:strand:+ start:3772 stop:4452 length:681 start_codon:yes stop_codon:yes gene_type:complete
MIHLKIDNKKFPITEDPTLDQWQKMMSLDFEYKGHWATLINIATGVPLDVLAVATDEQLRLGAVLVTLALQRRREVPVVDFNTLNLGQFIDMEYYLAQGLQKSIRKCLNTLEVETNTATEALWVIERYSQWRDNIYKQYAGLFNYDPQPLEEDEDSKPQTPFMIAKAWYRILVDLSGSDPLKIDSITKQPLKEMFNYLAMKKDIAQEELNQKKQQQREYELQRNRR